jgi:cyclophilin family peptidyl-prolyl cis-trans isomerase
MKQNTGRSVVSGCSIAALETRLLFTGEYIANPIAPVLANTASPASNSITLDHYFNDTLLPGTLATFTTTEGTVQVALTDAATPQTVANFLDYVNSGEYNYTIFHRSVDLNTGQNASPSDPATIVQGGGYNISSGGLAHIPTNSPVNDEYTTELYGDVQGTLAMAKTSTANSATSEWYFNTQDNTELDTPTTDSNGDQTSYTVFGKVVNGLSVLQTIAALPTYNLGSGLTSVPVTGLSEAQIQAGAGLSESNLVFVESITTEPGTSYTVSSDNPNLVTPKVSDGVLSFTYGSGFGTADVTITGKNLDGTSASTTMLVTVPNSATPSAGPTAASITAPYTVTGTSNSFPILTNSTDSLAALNPAGVKILSGPSHGTASVNTSNGYVTYTPATGYVGSDSLTYTVTDANGTTSNPATVTLSAVPGPVQVTVGAAGVTSLKLVQPDGISGVIQIKAGSAVVTFTNYQVTLSGPTNGVLTATGAGADITSIVVTNKSPIETANAQLLVTANGPIKLGSVSDTNGLLVRAPQATLTNLTTRESQLVQVGSLVDGVITFGQSKVLPGLLINSIVNSSIVSPVGIGAIDCTRWISNDGAEHSVKATAIFYLNVLAELDVDLDLTFNGYDGSFWKVADPNGTWTLNGSMFDMHVTTSPGTNWSVSAGGVLQSVKIFGNLQNVITCAAISHMNVTGTTTNSTIETSAGFSPRFSQIGQMVLSGAVTNSVIFAAGNINSITAGSFTNSRIYAGTSVTLAQNGTLATSSSDLESDAKINSFVTRSFSGSEISSDIIGSLHLGSIITTENNYTEGVSVHKGGSITGTLAPGGILNAGPAQLKSAAALSAYETKAKLKLGNFLLTLF